MDIKDIKKQELINPEDARSLLVSLYDTTHVPVNFRNIRYSKPGTFSVDDKEFTFSNAASKQLFSRMGVKQESFSKCDDDLRGRVVESILSHDDFEASFVVSREDNRVQRIVKGNAAYLSMLKVYDTVMDELKEWDPKVQLDVSPRMGAVVNFITKEETTVPDVGHIMRAGLTVRSKIEDFAPLLYMGPFTYTLQCTNGMVGETHMIKAVKDMTADKLLNLVKNSIVGWYGNSKENMIPRMIAMRDVKASDPSHIVHRLSKEMSFGARAKNLVLDRIPELGQNPTMYDLVYMMTETANEFDLDTKYRLQTAGGRLVNTVDHRCPQCSSVLN